MGAEVGSVGRSQGTPRGSSSRYKCVLQFDHPDCRAFPDGGRSDFPCTLRVACLPAISDTISDTNGLPARARDHD
jgi:hypothetical protein